MTGGRDEADPDDGDADAIELLIEGRPRELGGVPVRRVLPVARRRAVGPFVFLDHLGHPGHLGPPTLAPGQGVDVPPHPHIGLATITYLFDGGFVHRDSTGAHQPIRPGDVNWMIAGRGVVHSERTAPEARAAGGPLHGVQTWVALPQADEELAPSFEHHPAATLPHLARAGATLTIIAGAAYGATAPTGVRSPTLYVHARLAPGASLDVDDTHAERAVHVVAGEVACAGRAVPAGVMAVLRPGAAVRLHARAAAHVLLIGGAPLDGPRHIEWNFVSSTRARIEQAKADWRADRFPRVPGDEHERVPLPA